MKDARDWDKWQEVVKSMTMMKSRQLCQRGRNRIKTEPMMMIVTTIMKSEGIKFNKGFQNFCRVINS